MPRLIAFFLLTFLINAPVYSRSITVYPGSFYSNTWIQAQLMHLQTQQQLQSQDLYRRQLLMQDQQWQINRLADQRMLDELRMNSRLMHQYSDRLRRYSRSADAPTGAAKRK